MFPFARHGARLAAVVALVLLPMTAALAQEGPLATGGASRPQPPGPCIPPAEALRIRSASADFLARHPDALLPLAPSGKGSSPIPAGAAPYPFFPQAGKLWDDLFPVNFVDLDATSPGVRDYRGGTQSYDGHQGIDSDITTFTEQSIGVPVFAALDGVVTVAHDGEFDQNTSWSAGTPANYVVLRHAGTHETWYFHLKKNSVAVSVGQTVKAGTQLGLTASSGISTGPHLHFQSLVNGASYEPFAGSANPGTSGWSDQPVYRGTAYVRDFTFTTQNLSSWPGPPVDTTRTGTLVGLGTKSFYFWATIMNLPAASTYRLRFLRPNGTVRFDSGTLGFAGGTNPYYRSSYWWWSYNINFDVTGDWTLELSVNGVIAAQAPLTLASGAAVNRPPLAVVPVFDPPLAAASQAVFCRVPFRLVDDPDYDVVRYRYVWKRNGAVIRDVINASLADAVPAAACAPGDVLSCTVTPGDGVAEAVSATIATRLRPFSRHTADTDLDARIRLQELTRVIELFNTRHQATRTGHYTVDAASEDGFASAPSRSVGVGAVLDRYHSADTNYDGSISIAELVRVIELYNARNGTVRTGQYRVQNDSEDGFAPGP